MHIVFDPAKREATLRDRHLDMARAGEVFLGPSETRADDRRDYGEARYITIGFLEERMIVLVWTRRDPDVRIISMRKANEREQKIYAPRFR